MSHPEPDVQRYECPECAYGTREFANILAHMHADHVNWRFVSQLTYRGFVRRVEKVEPHDNKLRSIYWLRPAGKCACGAHTGQGLGWDAPDTTPVI